MSDSAAPLDAHDPLPESNWLWRRLFVFAVSATIMFLIFRYGDRLSGIAELAAQNQDSAVVIIGIRSMMNLMAWLLSGLFMMITFYMLAPSAEQVIKAFQIAKSLREGVVFTGASRISPSGAKTETTVSGQPITPPEAMPAAPTPTPATPEETDPWPPR